MKYDKYYNTPGQLWLARGVFAFAAFALSWCFFISWPILIVIYQVWRRS